MHCNKYDHLVIGSGVAGLVAAIKLSENKNHKICIITKGSIQNGSTSLAQGGISAAISSNDCISDHYKDTLRVGGGINDEEAAMIMAQNGGNAIDMLVNYQVDFDRHKNGDFCVTNEAGHAVPRVLHKKDYTGRSIVEGLMKTIKQRDNIILKEGMFAAQLAIVGKSCLGALVTDNSIPQIIFAKSTILATGGCGYIYSRTTNDKVATGDGYSLAFQAGCLIENMEFIQFHPTAFYQENKENRCFLISESLRGEGGVLKNINGVEFMNRYHKDGNLAPRDVASRAIFEEMKKTNAKYVYLDLSKINFNLKERYPSIYNYCLKENIDIVKDYIPISPAAHYCMGGVKTDNSGRTNIARLFAIGEVASTGVHGANRLASNSLLEGVVFGARAAQQAGVLSLLDSNSIKQYMESFNGVNLCDKPLSQDSCQKIKTEIRNLMWNDVGIIRSRSALKKTLKILFAYKRIVRIKTINKEMLELQNMLYSSALILFSAYKRKESRGSHYLKDFNASNKSLRHPISYGK